MGSNDELVGRAAKMLLNGATLLSQPCPYCSGVRVIKDGYALCVSCGQEPEGREVPGGMPQTADGRGARPGTAGDADGGPDAENGKPGCLTDALEEKLVALSKELAGETDRKKEIEILDSIDAVLSSLQKARQI